MGFIDGDSKFSDESNNRNERLCYYNKHNVNIPYNSNQINNSAIYKVKNNKEIKMDKLFKLKLKENYDKLQCSKRFYTECSSIGFYLFDLKNTFHNYELHKLGIIENKIIEVDVIKNILSKYKFYKYKNKYIIPLLETNDEKLTYKYNIPDGLIQLYINNNYETLFYELDEKFSSKHWVKSIISDCLYIITSNFNIPLENKSYYLQIKSDKVKLLIGNIKFNENGTLELMNIDIYDLQLNNLKYCIRHYCFNRQPILKQFNIDIPITYENMIEYRKLDNSVFLKLGNDKNIFYKLISTLIKNHKL